MIKVKHTNQFESPFELITWVSHTVLIPKGVRGEPIECINIRKV